jgi:hypothetical protein
MMTEGVGGLHIWFGSFLGMMVSGPMYSGKNSLHVPLHMTSEAD